jgi:hypothetical protein
MKEYEMTQDFYRVVETIHGLDVYDSESDQFVCEIAGMRLDNFTFDGKISEAELGQAIKEEIEVEEFLEDNKFT